MHYSSFSPLETCIWTHHATAASSCRHLGASHWHAKLPAACSLVSDLKIVLPLCALREGMNLGFRMTEIWWPSQHMDALERGLIKLQDDGKVALSSEDGSGRVVLHQHRRRVAVCFPLLIRYSLQNELLVTFPDDLYPVWIQGLRAALRVHLAFSGLLSGGHAAAMAAGD